MAKARAEKVVLPFVPRNVAKLDKWSENLAVVSKKLTKSNQTEIAALIDVAVERMRQASPLLAALGVDWLPKGAVQNGGSRMSLTVGQTVKVVDAYAEIYQLPKKAVCTVKQINKIGEGRGSKFFIRVETDKGAVLMGPATHFE